jgi:glutamate-ammonia-ligase adenylyltransferase
LTRKAGTKALQPGFAIKQGIGGIVDIEFMVQFLVLAQAHRCLALVRYPDNVRILEAAARCVLLTEDEINQLTESYLALRASLHEFALQHNESDAVDADVAGAVLQPLQALRDRVAGLWNKIFAGFELTQAPFTSDNNHK